MMTGQRAGAGRSITAAATVGPARDTEAMTTDATSDSTSSTPSTGRQPPALGITFVPTLPPERLRGLAVAADEAGLDELWVWEDCFKESAIASAAVALASTSRIRVGIGLMPVPLRNVALTAMEVATLARIFPGRLIAGVGHGVQPWMAQVGARPRSPLTLLREYTVALRALLHGEQVTTDGDYVRLDGVALDWPPDPPPPVMLGGDGPKSVTLTAELGDGTLLSAARSDDEIRAVMARVREVKGDAAHPLVAAQLVATGPDAHRRLDEELPAWGKSPGLGVGVAGDAEAIAASVRHLADLGCTSVAMQPTAHEPDLDGLVELLGSEVRAGLRRDP
jgi:5,10-methylenetetrahydromethanopterin reductase